MKSCKIFNVMLIVLIACLFITSLSCSKTSTTPKKTTKKITTRPSKPKARPVLVVAGSWSVDNQEHQEPMVVQNVTAASSGTLFVAFIASDSGQGPERGGPPLDGKIQSVEGGGLTWTRRAEAHLSVTGEPGISEIWTAFTKKPLAPFAITVTRNNDTGALTYCDNYTGGSGPDIANGMVFVQAITGADPKNPIGATAVAGVGERSGRPAAASVTLTTTRADSLIEAVGSDWSSSSPRILITGQIMLHENVSTPNGDNYWVQGLPSTVSTPSSATLGVTDPTDHACNMVAVEILRAP